MRVMKWRWRTTPFVAPFWDFLCHFCMSQIKHDILSVTLTMRLTRVFFFFFSFLFLAQAFETFSPLFHNSFTYFEQLVCHSFTILSQFVHHSWTPTCCLTTSYPSILLFVHPDIKFTKLIDSSILEYSNLLEYDIDLPCTFFFMSKCSFLARWFGFFILLSINR